MTYDEYRRALIDQYYDYQLESFINGFTPGKPNVILLPGGMGSQLERTSQPFPTSPNVINDVVWMDLGIVAGDALTLEIDNEGRDYKSHVTGAHGPFSFIGMTPYNELEDFARNEEWNYCVFGFDWRRSLAESAGNFQRFIENFDSGVKEKYGSSQEPIKALTVVCHSMGGLVCTDALRNPNFARLGFQAIVTIATPFYGTSTHQERYFRGVESLNDLNSYNRETVVRIIATLPGPYTLMLLPRVIYDRDGASLGLTRYPQYDHDNGTDADPYDSAMMDRWPRPVRDHTQFLVQARDELRRVAEPIDKVIAPAFHNVRSSLDNTTAVELKWKNINGDVIPAGSSPLTGVPGPGDGTVPAWSAFHAHCRATNRHELASAKAHGELLEHPEVLTLIKSFVRAGKRRAVARRTRVPAVADRSKVARVMATWSEKAKHNQPPPSGLFEEAVQRAFVTSLIAGDKPKMETAPKGLLRKREAVPPKKVSSPKKTPRRKQRR
jgi:PGAP1-like protein